MKHFLSAALLIGVLACGSSPKHYPPPPDARQDTSKNEEVTTNDARGEVKGTADTSGDTRDTQVGDTKWLCKTNVDCTDAPLDVKQCQVKVCNHQTGSCEVAWNKNCCMDKVFLDEGFENGMPKGWVIKDSDTNDAVTWSVVDDKALDGKKSLYMGDPKCHTYYNGPMTDCKPDDKKGDAGTNFTLSVETPTITLPPTKGTFVLSFYVWIEAEAMIPGLSDTNQPDQLNVLVLYGKNFASHDRLFSSIQIQKNTNGHFKFIATNLQSYTGKPIRIKFVFDTLSSKDNFHRGIYIDDIKLFSACKLDRCHSGDKASSDQDPCTDDSCIVFSNQSGSGYYAHPKDPYCGGECTQDTVKTDCPTNDPCKQATCKDHKCVYTDIQNCCITKNLFKDDFESGNLDQYSVQEGTHNNDVKWQITDQRAAQGKKALYYGDTIQHNYNSGSMANFGYITTPSVDVPAKGYTALTFQLFMSTEWDDKDTYVNPAKNDLFYVEAVERTGTTPDSPVKATTIWESGQIKGTTKGTFIPVGIDLTPFAGKKISIRFNFFTGDNQDNDKEGIYIDSLSIDSDTCKHVECKGAWDCRVDGTCRTGTCKDGTCDVKKADDTCCSADIDCIDDTDCTNDWCEANQCKHQFHDGPHCCQPKDIAKFDFDSGTMPDGFTVNNSCNPISSEDGKKCPGWQVTDKKSNSGVYSLYFGNGKNYEKSGQKNEPSKGMIETPPFVVPMWGDTEVSFKCLILIDPADKDQTDHDILNVDVVRVKPDGTDGDAKTLASRGNGIPALSDNPNQFDTVSKLSINKVAPAFRGHKVRLRFTFNSLDQVNNKGLGVFIDDITIQKACPAENK